MEISQIIPFFGINLLPMVMTLPNSLEKELKKYQTRQGRKKSSFYIVCVYLDSKTTEQDPIVVENLSNEDLNMIQIGLAL